MRTSIVSLFAVVGLAIAQNPAPLGQIQASADKISPPPLTPSCLVTSPISTTTTISISHSDTVGPISNSRTHKTRTTPTLTPYNITSTASYLPTRSGSAIANATTTGGCSCTSTTVVPCSKNMTTHSRPTTTITTTRLSSSIVAPISNSRTTHPNTTIVPPPYVPTTRTTTTAGPTVTPFTAAASHMNGAVGGVVIAVAVGAAMLAGVL